MSLTIAFQSRTIAYQWIKIEKVVFIQANQSFDLSGLIKLAKFRAFIYSKMEHKINKIRRNLHTSDHDSHCRSEVFNGAKHGGFSVYLIDTKICIVQVKKSE